MKCLARLIVINLLFLITIMSLAGARHFPAGTRDIFITNSSNVRKEALNNIAPIVEKSIESGKYPGAVIFAAHKGDIIYRGAFGNKRIIPDIAPMSFDTIFDVASLTKVVATAPSIMLLIEQGKLELDKQVSHYWPEFARNGKEKVTIRQLLTHTSGLPAELPKTDPMWQGEAAAIRLTETIGLINPIGTTFVYSDVGFIALGCLIDLVSNKKINTYANDNVFKVLNMNNTLFLPSATIRDRVAPTESFDSKLQWGEVHDPIAYAMDGVAGHAGLFSTAHDLGIYAECLVNDGRLPKLSHNKEQSHYLLAPLTVKKMVTAQTPPGMSDVRGLGWDVDSKYSSRGVLFPVSSFGHTGWTGTSMWIDPNTKTWVIILTSRTHPIPSKDNKIIEDRRLIANIIASSITDVSPSQLTNTGKGELNRAYNFAGSK